jgi:hypothetical protein
MTRIGCRMYGWSACPFGFHAARQRTRSHQQRWAASVCALWISFSRESSNLHRPVGRVAQPVGRQDQELTARALGTFAVRRGVSVCFPGARPHEPQSRERRRRFRGRTRGGRRSLPRLDQHAGQDCCSNREERWKHARLFAEEKIRTPSDLKCNTGRVLSPRHYPCWRTVTAASMADAIGRFIPGPPRASRAYFGDARGRRYRIRRAQPRRGCRACVAHD